MLASDRPLFQSSATAVLENRADKPRYEWPTIRPEGVLREVYTPEATREELAAAVGQVLDILSDDEEEDE